MACRANWQKLYWKRLENTNDAPARQPGRKRGGRKDGGEMNPLILQGNVIYTLKTIPAGTVRCVVTSPPYYGLRSYLKAADPLKEYEIGTETTPELYISKLVDVFRLVWDALADNGTLWLNLGDSYWANRSTNGETGGEGGSAIEYAKNQARAGGKSHNVYKQKDLMMIPARVAIALQQDGWYLRSEIVWQKPNPMPESVKDRPTRSHEMIYLLSKSEKYYYDYEAILEPVTDSSVARLSQDIENQTGSIRANGGAKTNGNMKAVINKNLLPDGQQLHSMHIKRANGEGEPKLYGLAGSGFDGHSGNMDADGNSLLYEKDGIPARNKRDVWTVTTKPYSGAHFATFPPDLIEPCILAGSAIGDTVLDPFGGSGTTASVAIKHNRKAILCELNNDYVSLIQKRMRETQPLLLSAFMEL